MFNDIVRQQRDFFNTGQTRSLNFRLNQLKKLKNQIQSYETELLEALHKDLHKSETEGYLTELGVLYLHLDDTIKHLKKWAKPQRTRTPLFLQPAKSEIRREPYGVSLIIGPFNYPVLLIFDPLIGAIAGGNTALIGLSEEVPNTNKVIQQLIGEIFEKKYITTYITSIDANQAVLGEKFDKIFFTGSEFVGKIVAKSAATNLTPITLELGGKSPAIVTKFADIELAAQRIIWGKFLNAGQTCVAPDYCLVDNQVKGELLEEMRSVLIKQFGSNPQLSPDFGRIVNAKSIQRLEKIIKSDQDYLWLGGTVDVSDRYIEPTILVADLLDPLEAMMTEIFGPIFPVLGYDKLGEAVQFIKRHPHPLAFYPFSNKKPEINWLVNQVDCGGITVNDTILHLANDRLPFGGVGPSGMGDYHGIESIRAFTYNKSVLKRSRIISIPFLFPPYTEKKHKIIRLFLK